MKRLSEAALITVHNHRAVSLCLQKMLKLSTSTRARVKIFPCRHLWLEVL